MQDDSNYWSDVRKHQINFSSSKQTYGFPKQQRFKSTSKVLCDSFYNIPSAIGKSPKSGIGLGKKAELARRTDSPSPNKYNVTSDFDLTKKNLSLGKFALGRDKIKNNCIFTKNQNPPPGNYNIRGSLIHKNSISIHPKLGTPKKSYEFNPGPSHYSSFSTLNATGRYIISTVNNTAGTKIKPSKQFDASKSRVSPGPGTYNTQKQNMNTTGNFFNSRYQNSRCRTFSRSSRKDLSVTSRKFHPGPGAYNYFSDFGSRIRKI